MKPNKFWSGWLVAIAHMSLYEDYLGKDEYLRRVNEWWVDSSVSIPVAIAILILAVWLGRDVK